MRHTSNKFCFSFIYFILFTFSLPFIQQKSILANDTEVNAQNNDEVSQLYTKKINQIKPSRYIDSTNYNSSNNQIKSIYIEKLVFNSNTLFDYEQLEKQTNHLLNQRVSFVDIKRSVDNINRLYAEKGFSTSKAYLPKQEIADGILTINIQEGWLGEIRVDGNVNVSKRYIESRLRLGNREKLNLVKLDRQIRNLKKNPLFDDIKGNCPWHLTKIGCFSHFRSKDRSK